MYHLFFSCAKLEKLPDISKWETNKVINISEIFFRCSLLNNIPDISK